MEIIRLSRHVAMLPVGDCKLSPEVLDPCLQPLDLAVRLAFGVYRRPGRRLGDALLRSPRRRDDHPLVAGGYRRGSPQILACLPVVGFPDVRKPHGQARGARLKTAQQLSFMRRESATR